MATLRPLGPQPVKRELIPLLLTISRAASIMRMLLPSLVCMWVLMTSNGMVATAARPPADAPAAPFTMRTYTPHIAQTTPHQFSSIHSAGLVEYSETQTK